MHNYPTLLRAAALAALALVAACESEPEVVGELSDPDRGQIEELDPDALPPMEERSAIYRCADNSVVYVTFYTGDTQVAVSAESNGPQTFLPNAATADALPEPSDEAANETTPDTSVSDGPVTFSGDGYTLVGTGESIELTRPGGGSQNCHT